MLKRQREEEDVEISDDEDEAMAWSPGRKHKVVIHSCTQYTCSHLTNFSSPQASSQAEHLQDKDRASGQGELCMHACLDAVTSLDSNDLPSRRQS
jgi:hypothetical protein